MFMLAAERELDETTWVGAFAPELIDATTTQRYIVSLYWAATTFTTVGYESSRQNKLIAFTFPNPRR